MSNTARGVPGVNDLVRVSLGEVDDSDDELASDLPSRVEDLSRDQRTGLIVGYVIAAPRFPGDVEEPAMHAPCSLQWPTPRGMGILPATFQAQETVGNRLRVWRLRVTGPPQRNQRRRFVRVPWSLPTRLEIRRDLDALDPHRRELIELSGVQAALEDLPDALEGRAVNVSEGGLLCLTLGPVLPTHLPLIAGFTLETTCFTAPAYVIWSTAREYRGKIENESALAFDNPASQSEVLRPLLFQAELKARRAEMR